MLQLETHAASRDAQLMLTHFFDLPSRTSKRVLLLDYDGTLAPLTADRNRAVPYPAIPGLLDWIRSVTRTRLVIVTERRAFQVATLLGLKHIEIWGCHGLSRWRSDGTYELPKLDEEALSRISDANELLRQQGLDDLLEFKPGGTAVHWRGLEAHANHIARSVERVWSRLHSRKGLQLLKFDGGMEIRVAARDKADVVRTILCETGPGAAIAYLGDDHTDEDAFAALHRHGLTVLVHREYRPTAADVWIRPPEQLVSFLADWIAACGAASSLQRNTAA